MNFLRKLFTLFAILLPAVLLVSILVVWSWHHHGITFRLLLVPAGLLLLAYFLWRDYPANRN